MIYFRGNDTFQGRLYISGREDILNWHPDIAKGVIKIGGNDVSPTNSQIP